MHQSYRGLRCLACCTRKNVPYWIRHEKQSINRQYGSIMHKISCCYCTNHVHVYLLHQRGYQDFGSAERNQGLKHDLTSKFQVRPFGHARTWDTIFYFSCEYIYYKLFIVGFVITPKYHPMSLFQIQTHNIFASILFHNISVNSMKRTLFLKM